MAKRQALGRGLSALLENSPAPTFREMGEEQTVGHVAGTVMMLQINQVEANPFQPRSNFNQDALNELAQSISSYGIIQPLTVRKVGARKYQLISGERRFRASQIAELDEIPCYIREADDQEMLEMALVENIQRENLDPVEVAISYQRLIEECNLTQEELSSKVGKSRSAVTNFLRLLKLPAEIQVGLIEKKISMGHARALVNAGEEGTQIKLFRRTVKDDLSVRKVEELVRHIKSGTQSTRTVAAPLSVEDRQTLEMLRKKLGGNVSLKRNSSGSGKVEIGFRNSDDLQNILDLLND